MAELSPAEQAALSVTPIRLDSPSAPRSPATEQPATVIESTLDSATSTTAFETGARPTEEPILPQATEARSPDRVTQDKVIEGGNPDLEIRLDTEGRQSVIRRLTNRANKARELQEKQQRLSDLDLQLLRPDFLKRIQSGELITEDLMLAWYELDEELIQKEIAAGAIMIHQPGRFERVRNMPMVGRLIGDPNAVPAGRLDTAGNLLNDPEFSAYLRDIRYDQMSGQDIYDDLVSLDRLRINLESSFFRNGHRNPIFDRARNRLRGRPIGLDFLRDEAREAEMTKTGHKLYSEINSQIQEVIAQRIINRPADFHAGDTIEAIYTRDPIEGLRIRQEASTRALSQKARDYSLEIVKGERYNDIDTSAIEARAKETEQPAKPEEIAPLLEAKTKADAELATAEATVAELRARLPQLELDVQRTGTQKKKADEIFKAIEARYSAQISLLQTEQTSLGHALTALSSTPTTAPASPGGKGKPGGIVNIGPGESMRLSIKDIMDRIASYESEIKEAQIAQVNAGIDNESAINELDRIRGNETSPGSGIYTGGKINTAEAELPILRSAAQTANEAYKAKEGEIGEGGVSPERQERARALRVHIKIAEGQGQIHELQYAQKFDGEFTREGLSDITTRTDGQIEGAERIRAHIIQTIDKAGYDPNLARKIYSDETIAIALIESFSLEGASITLPGGAVSNFGDEIQALQLAKEQLQMTPVSQISRRETLGQQITERQRILIQQALPQLANAQQMEISHFINKLINRGLISAELGDPYLKMVR